MRPLEFETVGQLVAEMPARSRVFERLGIDYCCGGKRPLNTVCAEKGLDPRDVVRELESCDDAPQAGQQDWIHAPLTALADHIELTHHAFLKSELPRVAALLTKIAKVHGVEHPELLKVEQIFHHFRGELEQHMMKEEQILFPMCRQLELASVAPGFHCGSIGNPIRVMEAEHDAAGEAMGAFRALTNGYKPPKDACGSYLAALEGLAHIESDMHQHVHKENNILFPRARSLEEKLTKNPTGAGR